MQDSAGNSEASGSTKTKASLPYRKLLERKRIATSDLLTPQEAADYLRIGVRTLANWRSTRHPDRSIPFVKIGRCVMYRQAALDAFIAQNECGTFDARAA